MKSGWIGIAALLTLLGEAAPALAVSFSRADANRDGEVSFEEAERAFPKLNRVHIEKADQNRDGVISEGEMPFLNSFDRFNSNR